MNYVLIAAIACLVTATTQAVVNEEEDAPKASRLTKKVDDKIVKADEYEHAAVATDHETCSKVGKDVLKKGGSAVDGAIASLFCLGTVQFQSTGIGGGGFLLYYEKATGKMHGFDFRETLPAEDNEKLYNEDRDRTSFGGMAVGVPSEVKGLRTVWEKFGKLDWKELVQPSIDLAKEGFKPSRHLAFHAKKKKKAVKDEVLRNLITHKNGSAITENSTIKRPNYAKTLETIRDNPNDFYTGDLAKMIIQDIQEKGGSMTLDDLANYQVKQREAIKMELDSLILHTLPLPSGGPILKHILSMCKEMNLGKDDLKTTEKAIETYHRIVEAFKISHVYRSYIGDPDFVRNKVQFTKMREKVLDENVAKAEGKKINENQTQPLSFYTDMTKAVEEDGTTHVSLLAENGDAVATTSTINSKFGALFSSKTTGIVYNNEIKDTFSTSSPNHNYVELSQGNAPVPGARPLSSAAPNIILDKKGNVVMVSGASGGSRITLSVAWVTMLKLWFGMDLGNAVVTSRPYHTLFPQYIRNEKWQFAMKDEIVEGLKKKKHVVKSSRLTSEVQAIFVDSNSDSKKIYAMSDPRKNGKTAGY
eukprot:gene13926-15377_t